MELRGRTALVTGAGHRVGRAIALALGARGMRVAVHYNAAADGARETVDQIRAAGGDGSTVGADLTQPEAAGTLVSAVAKTFGGLDVLVNSAAVMIRTPFGEVTAKQWDDIMALNLRAPFFSPRPRHRCCAPRGVSSSTSPISRHSRRGPRTCRTEFPSRAL